MKPQIKSKCIRERAGSLINRPPGQSAAGFRIALTLLASAVAATTLLCSCGMHEETATSRREGATGTPQNAPTPTAPPRSAAQTLAPPANLSARNVSGRESIDLGGGNTLSKFVSYMRVTWDAVPGADNYTLSWSASSNVVKETANVITNVVSPFRHNTDINGGRLYYRVSATKGGKESDLSPEISVTAPSGFVPL